MRDGDGELEDGGVERSLEEGVLDYLKQKVRDVRDFHAGILTSFLSTMKQTFGEFGEDAKKVMQAYRDGKLKPKQIEEISAALNEKDERGNKRPNWGKVFATLAKLGIFLVTALSVSSFDGNKTFSSSFSLRWNR